MFAVLAIGACAGRGGGGPGPRGAASSAGHHVSREPYLTLMRGDAARSLQLLDQQGLEEGEVDIDSGRAAVRLGALCELGREAEAEAYVEQLLDEWRRELSEAAKAQGAGELEVEPRLHLFHVAPELTHSPEAKACADRHASAYNARAREIAGSTLGGEPAGASIGVPASP